jgi:hypothetical protein
MGEIIGLIQRTNRNLLDQKEMENATMGSGAQLAKFINRNLPVTDENLKTV